MGAGPSLCESKWSPPPRIRKEKELVIKGDDDGDIRRVVLVEGGGYNSC